MLLQKTGTKNLKTHSIKRFGGINARSNAASGEFRHSINISLDDYPAACALKPDKKLFDLSSITHIISDLTQNEEYDTFSGLTLLDIYINSNRVGDNLKVSANSKILSFKDKILSFPEGMEFRNNIFRYTGYFYNLNSVYHTSGGLEGASLINQYTPGVTFDSIKKGDRITLEMVGNSTWTGRVHPSNPNCCYGEVSSITSSAGIYLYYYDKFHRQVVHHINNYDASAGKQFILRKFMPPFIDAAVRDERLFGVWENRLYISKTGDHTDFHRIEYEADGTQSLSNPCMLTVEKGGDFTAIHGYKNKMLLFKKNGVYMLLGESAPDFKIRSLADIGCIDKNSISATADGSVIFLSFDGVYFYNGREFKKVSSKLPQSRFIRGRGICYGDKYYLSAVTENGHIFYIYHYNMDIWSKKSTGEVKDFARYPGGLYAALSDGYYKIEGEDNCNGVEWEAELNAAFDDTLSIKQNLYLRLNLKLDEESRFNVYTSYDNLEFKKIFSSSAPYEKPYYIPLDINSGRCIKIKLTGTGGFKLYELERTFVIRGRI